MPFPNVAINDREIKGVNALGQVYISKVFKPREVPQGCPSSIIDLLSIENIENVQFFEAFLCHRACFWRAHAFPKSYSYLPQFWAMPNMPLALFQSVIISSGIFDPKNLVAIGQEIGLNSLVEQKMPFDGRNSLCMGARFKKINNDVGTSTSGWFFSVYDPEKNMENLGLYGNFYAEEQRRQGKRAIVVFFRFVEPSWETDLGSNAEIDLSLKPQFPRPDFCLYF
jgi:hypothetical protein